MAVDADVPGERCHLIDRVKCNYALQMIVMCRSLWLKYWIFSNLSISIVCHRTRLWSIISEVRLRTQTKLSHPTAQSMKYALCHWFEMRLMSISPTIVGQRNCMNIWMKKLPPPAASYDAIFMNNFQSVNHNNGKNRWWLIAFTWLNQKIHK